MSEFTLRSDPIPYAEMLKNLKQGECFASGNEVYRVIKANSATEEVAIHAEQLIDEYFKKAMDLMPDRKDYIENKLVLAISQPCFIDIAAKDDDGLVTKTGKTILSCLIVGRYMDNTIFEKTGSLCFGLELDPETRRFVMLRKQAILSVVH